MKLKIIDETKGSLRMEAGGDAMLWRSPEFVKFANETGYFKPLLDVVTVKNEKSINKPATSLTAELFHSC